MKEQVLDDADRWEAIKPDGYVAFFSGLAIAAGFSCVLVAFGHKWAPVGTLGLMLAAAVLGPLVGSVLWGFITYWVGMLLVVAGVKNDPHAIHKILLFPAWQIPLPSRAGRVLVLLAFWTAVAVVATWFGVKLSSD